MDYEAIMIDLETLGTQPNAAVVQIGAAAFNYDMEEMASISIDIIPDHIDGINFSVDYSTIRWWITQSDEARKGITRTPRSTATEGLQDFDKFFKDICDPKCEVWAHPSKFDIPILENMYKVYGIDIPWDRRNVRCVTTLRSLSGKVKRPSPTLKHDAGYDAVAQAKWVNLMKATIKHG